MVAQRGIDVGKRVDDGFALVAVDMREDRLAVTAAGEVLGTVDVVLREQWSWSWSGCFLVGGDL